ncbi:MAG: hypothetical protein BWY42_01218 [Candidatus Omnitrophica bacterium ADurb.Bin277]|nr:MAG: hypothetical protein BWY42_01218 [Candidatus Omnitrophica bacterium ADurb.Bin277]
MSPGTGDDYENMKYGMKEHKHRFAARATFRGVGFKKCAADKNGEAMKKKGAYSPEC